MSAVNSSGTQTAVISTEHTLGTPPTAAGTYVLAVDLSNMVDGDVVELRMKRKVLTGGTIRQTLLAVFSNAQSDLVAYSIPVPTPWGVTATLKQTAGTGRNFDWSLETI